MKNADFHFRYSLAFKAFKYQARLKKLIFFPTTRAVETIILHKYVVPGRTLAISNTKAYGKKRKKQITAFIANVHVHVFLSFLFF